MKGWPTLYKVMTKEGLRYSDSGKHPDRIKRVRNKDRVRAPKLIVGRTAHLRRNHHMYLRAQQ